MTAKPQSTFDLAFSYTVGNEGGYSNVSGDSGGATRWGITLQTLSVWLKRPASVAEVKDLSLDTAKEIYEAHYWKPLGCDLIDHQGSAICLFDLGVVRGIGVPPKYAQEICNARGAKLVVDGHLGPISIAAINKIAQADFVKDFATKARVGFETIVQNNSSQAKFLAGWRNRANRLLTLAKLPDIVDPNVPVTPPAPAPVPATPEVAPAPVVAPPSPHVEVEPQAIAPATLAERIKLALQILFKA